MIDKQFFKQYQKQLLKFSNTKLGKWIFRINKKLLGTNVITSITPNSFAWVDKIENGKIYHKAIFYANPQFAVRINKIFSWLPFNAVKRVNLGGKWFLQPKLGLTTTEFYTDKFPGDTDNNMVGRETTNSTLSALRSGAGTYAGDDGASDLTIYIKAGTTTNNFVHLHRGLAFFDTSAIPDGDDIDSAKFSCQGTANTQNLGATNLHIGAGDATDVTDIVAGDYAQANHGTTSFGSIASSAYNVDTTRNEITFNQAGLDNISKTGITGLSLQYEWDINNNFTGSWGTNLLSYFTMYSTNNATESYRPYLSITYSTPVVAPTVTTQSATNIAQTTMTGNGNITATGGANATRRGFCYIVGTSGDPTTANSVAYEDGDFGVGAYTKGIIGLTEGTNYRVRAYAINSVGTSYGTTVQEATTNAYTKTLTESTTISDSISKATNRILSETINITDTIHNSISRVLSEIISIAENFSAIKILSKVISDTITTSDTIIKSTNKVISETINITENFIRHIVRIASDSITITEDFCSDILKILSETISVTENFITTTILARILTETITMTESFLKIPVKIMSEAITMTENLTKVAVLKKTLTEAISMTEQMYGKINGVNIKWYRKYSEKVGTFYKKYFKDI